LFQNWTVSRAGPLASILPALETSPELEIPPEMEVAPELEVSPELEIPPELKTASKLDCHPLSLQNLDLSSTGNPSRTGKRSRTGIPPELDCDAPSFQD